jgi:hypothetical protein
MKEHKITADPATSYWLKEQIKVSKTRDIVDAIADTETLLEILNDRFTNVVKQARLSIRNQK